MTEREYLRTSFPDLDREYYGGEIRERGLPDLPHASAVRGFVRVLCAPRLHPLPSLRLRVASGQYRIPDLSVFGPELPPGRLPEAPPLIAIEVASDDRFTALRAKLAEYRDYGVRHVWLAEPDARAFSVFDGKLREVDLLGIPEVNLTITPADVFGAL